MKELAFVQSCPDDDYYIWQVHTWLESLRELGHSNKAISLIFTPNYREPSRKWEKLVKLYPESEFFFHKDTDNITRFLGVYIPVLRPYMLAKYFDLHPEMTEKAVFYCDSDIVFTKNFNIDAFIDDDINYVSDTNSYINAAYFDRKIQDVLPQKLEKYKQRDILDETTKLVGINRAIAEKYNQHSGGAQYLLKNIDSAFWKKFTDDCIKIRVHLMMVNKEFFESEVKGFQSWCADMWSMLYNIWLTGAETRVIPEMEFAWSSDKIEKLDKVGILHNAGITGDTQGDIPVFFKGKYHNGTSPFDDPYVYKVLNDEKSKTLCSWYYLTKVIEARNKVESFVASS